MAEAPAGTADPAQTELWGLDTLFHAHAKLYIRDIHALQPAQGYSGIFLYKTHPVIKVDILGVVVRVDEKSKFFLYTLDDGTGVINCTWFKPEKPPRIGSLCPELEEKLCELEEHDQRALEGYSHGDLLHVRGKLQEYRQRMTLTLDYCALVDDPNMETKRMLLMPTLYRQFYNKPATLPKGIKDIAFKGDLNQIGILNKLETSILSHVSAKNMQEITKTDVLLLDDVRTLLQKSENPDEILDFTLTNMEKAGQLFKKVSLTKNDSRQVYIVTSQCKDLERQIFNVIQRWQGSVECDDCPASHIYATIRKLLPYSKVEHASISYCLEKLESQSDIISTADKCYIAFDNT